MSGWLWRIGWWGPGRLIVWKVLLRGRVLEMDIRVVLLLLLVVVVVRESQVEGEEKHDGEKEQTEKGGEYTLSKHKPSRLEKI